MAGTARVLVLVALVASAGCVGLTERSLPDELAGYAGDPDNPYGSENLTVAVTTADAERSFAPLVAEAVDYWETHDERYLNYSVNVTVAANASDPDIRVSFVPHIARCGPVADAAGCAPEITAPSQTGDTVEVRALDNLSANSTVRVLEHEFGHALGLGHGDPPRDLMATHTTLTGLPKPDASERALAWNDSTLSVFVTDEASAAEREGIDHALDYYDRGANGTVPENVSFHMVSSFANADVVIRPAERSPCASARGRVARSSAAIATATARSKRTRASKSPTPVSTPTPWAGTSRAGSDSASASRTNRPIRRYCASRRATTSAGATGGSSHRSGPHSRRRIE